MSDSNNGTQSESTGKPNVRRENQKKLTDLSADAQLKSAAAQILVAMVPIAEVYNTTAAAHAKMLAEGFELRTTNAKLTTETLSAVEAAKRVLITQLLEVEKVKDIELIKAKLEAINDVGTVPVKVVEVERGPREFSFREEC